jgi:PIN domain nuclease of toxin-antitoxin system
MNLLLDTCCLIWAISEPASLSDKARGLLSNDNVGISVSVISIAAIACAVERNRISIDRPWKT